MLPAERLSPNLDKNTTFQIQTAICMYLTDQEKAIGLLANQLAPEVRTFEDIDVQETNGDDQSPHAEQTTKSIPKMLESARAHIFENIHPYETPTSEQMMKAFKLYEQAKSLIVDVAQNKRPLTERDVAIIRTGIRARQFLILSNMKLVAFFSARYSRDNHYFEDTLQAGMLGLIATVEKFDYGKDTELSTYAAFWIRRYMARTISDEPLIKIPLYLSVAINMQKKQEILGQEEDTIAESRMALMRHAQVVMNTRDLEEEVGDDLQLEEVISDTDDFLEKLSRTWVAEDLQDLFEEVITPKEELVLKLCYGIGMEYKLTQQEIADKMGYTTKRIQQISLTARKKIRDYFFKQGISNYRRSFDVI